MASSSATPKISTDVVEFLSPPNDDEGAVSSFSPSFSLSTVVAAAATRRGNEEKHENFSSVDNLKQNEQQRVKQCSFLNNGREGGKNDKFVQVSAMSLQKYQDFIPSSFSYAFFNGEGINKNETPLSRNKLPVISDKKEQQNTRGNFNNESISSSSSSAQNYSSSFSSLFEEINHDTNDLDKNSDDDSSVLSDKSVTSNIFDDEESIVVDCTNKQTFSSSTTALVGTNNNRGTTMIKGTTFFVGGQEGNEEQEQEQEHFKRSETMEDTLDFVTILLNGTTEDDFGNFNNNKNGNSSSSQGLHSSPTMSLSSTSLLEPTPISTEPGRIQVIPTVMISASSPAAVRQEDPQPLLSKYLCPPSRISLSKRLLWNDHDHDIEDHVIKVLLNCQEQSSSSPPPSHNQEECEDHEASLAAHHETTKVDFRSCQKQHCPSAFTIKKRSFSGEWNDEDDDLLDVDDSWFATIDGNSSLCPCSKMEHTANEDIFVQPPPSRKKSRVDDDSDAAIVIQPEYLENENQDDGTTTSTEESNKNRFRTYQAEQWWQRLQDIMEFQKIYGHCNVPNTFPENQILSQWVKRQRYQYKLKQEGKHSTLTDERETILQNMGFIWDSHGALWAERWNELKEFYDKVGHSNVPTHYSKNRQLAIWVKCQRRQYKLYVAGDPKSNMTIDRIKKLELLDFVWHPKVGAKSAEEKLQYSDMLNL